MTSARRTGAGQDDIDVTSVVPPGSRAPRPTSCACIRPTRSPTPSLFAYRPAYADLVPLIKRRAVALRYSTFANLVTASMIQPRLDSLNSHAAEYLGTWSPFSTSDSATSVCVSSDLSCADSGDMQCVVSKGGAA